MKFAVVTTYAHHHWSTHAKRCVSSFTKFWGDIPLVILTDEALEEESEWLSEFKRRHAHRPISNYRFDAVRFSHKVAAIDLAFTHTNCDVLVWMDSDCVTHAYVDEKWLSSLLGSGDFAYLRRTNKYPECGFMMMRTSSMPVGTFLGDLISLYKTDALFKLSEWHDSFAIEHCRLRTPGLKSVSLSGTAEGTGHPFVNGPLGARLDHLKGTRKSQGRSRASDIKVKRTEAHWL